MQIQCMWCGAALGPLPFCLDCFRRIASSGVGEGAPDAFDPLAVFRLAEAYALDLERTREHQALTFPVTLPKTFGSGPDARPFHLPAWRVVLERSRPGRTIRLDVRGEDLAEVACLPVGSDPPHYGLWVSYRDGRTLWLGGSFGQKEASAHARCLQTLLRREVPEELRPWPGRKPSAFRPGALQLERAERSFQACWGRLRKTRLEADDDHLLLRAPSGQEIHLLADDLVRLAVEVEPGSSPVFPRYRMVAQHRRGPSIDLLRGLPDPLFAGELAGEAGRVLGLAPPAGG